MLNDFYKKALRRNKKMTGEQLVHLLKLAADDLERLESVLDSLNEAVLVVNTEHRMILANLFARRFLPSIGNMPRHLQDEPVWKVPHDERIAAFLEKTLRDGDRVEGREFELEIHNTPKIFSISVYPLVSMGRVTGSLIHVDDATGKRGREAAYRRAESLASLTTLAAGVAHEIKNPLGSLSIHVQLMQKMLSRLNAEKTVQAKLDKYLSVINGEIDRLNGIAVDFLLAVRPLNIKLLRGDLLEFLKELCDFILPELKVTGITLKTRFASDIPLLDFDEALLKQALLNLVKNSIAAIHSGGVLTLSAGMLEGQAFISVKDTGCGIAPSKIDKIFEPYFTTRADGTGLGLTMVYKIIKEHRGDITVRSREGEGTVFLIHLPIPQTDTLLLGINKEE